MFLQRNEIPKISFWGGEVNYFQNFTFRLGSPNQTPATSKIWLCNFVWGQQSTELTQNTYKVPKFVISALNSWTKKILLIKITFTNVLEVLKVWEWIVPVSSVPSRLHPKTYALTF